MMNAMPMPGAGPQMLMTGSMPQMMMPGQLPPMMPQMAMPPMMPGMMGMMPGPLPMMPQLMGMPMAQMMGMMPMAMMMPMMCRMTVEVTKEGLVCKMSPADPNQMEALRERANAMSAILAMGMPCTIACGGMPMMLATR
jgi:hypothetical protein